MTYYDAIVVGGGQSGLAAAHHLRRRGLDTAIIEAGSEPVRSWPHYYDSLALFSPAKYSSLPGLPFGGVGSIRSLKHTIVTEDLGRAQRTMVDLFQADDLGENTYELAGTRVCYLSPAQIPTGEFVPVPSLLGRPQADLYYAVTLEVENLEQARHHLVSVARDQALSTGRRGFGSSPRTASGCAGSSSPRLHW